MKNVFLASLVTSPFLLIAAALGGAARQPLPAIAMEPAIAAESLAPAQCAFTYTPDFSPVNEHGEYSEADRTKRRIQHFYLSATYWANWACETSFEAGQYMNWSDRMGTNQSAQLIEEPQHWLRGVVLFNGGDPVVYTAAEIESSPEIRQKVAEAFQSNAALHQAGYLFEWAYPGSDATH